MGALKIDEDGIRVEGKAEFDKPVKFSELSTPDVSFSSSESSLK